jgi:hypothetical protein
MNAIAFIVLAVVVGASAPIPERCQNETQQVGTCGIVLQVCRSMRGVKWRYDATATDELSGRSTKSADNRNGTEAKDRATAELFSELDSCNCETQSVPYGHCTLIVKGCYLFASATAMHEQKAIYKMTITDQDTGIAGHFCCADDPAGIFSPALADLEKKESLAHCLQ